MQNNNIGSQVSSDNILNNMKKNEKMKSFL